MYVHCTYNVMCKYNIYYVYVPFHIDGFRFLEAKLLASDMGFQHSKVFATAHDAPHPSNVGLQQAHMLAGPAHQPHLARQFRGRIIGWKHNKGGLQDKRISQCSA